MRETEFRVWHKKKLRPLMAERILTIDFGSTKWGGGITVLVRADRIEKWAWEDVELMEYTGLKDKNGQKIFEGDIVKAVLQEYNEPPREVIEEVIIHDGFLAPFYMRVNCEEDWWKDCLADGFEVIGNIYEQPELIR